MQANNFTANDIVNLSVELGKSLLLQRTYGKQGGEIKILTKIFADDLKEFEPQEVLEAVQQWRRQSPDFPTPADIINLLQPQPKFDYGIYNRIMQKVKSGGYLNDKETRYIEQYEQNAMKGI